MNLSVVPYDNKYLPQIMELWGEQYDNEKLEKRKKLFEWITQANPFLNRIDPYYLLLDGEKVVGMHGLMPLMFSINGKQQRGYFAHDTLISKGYRGKGLGKVILEQMIKMTDSFAGALWFNEPNYRLYNKSNWLDVPNLSAYLKVNNPEYFLRKIIKNKVARGVVSEVLKVALAAKEKISNARFQSSTNIIEVEKFDHRLDDFFSTIEGYYGIMTVRNHAYLNWKFVLKPYNNYRKFIAMDGFGNIAGYIVVKTEKIDTSARGRILDFLVKPGQLEMLRAMLLHCCRELSKNNVAYIQLTTSSPVVRKIVKECGFMKARRPVYFMIKKWEGIFEKNFVANIDNWYVTESDGDGDSWSVDC